MHCRGLPWPFKFPFHEQMKHFILYDFPAMAVIPFHLSGTGDDGRRTRVPGCWRPVLSTGEDTFTFTAIAPFINSTKVITPRAVTTASSWWVCGNSTQAHTLIAGWGVPKGALGAAEPPRLPCQRRAGALPEHTCSPCCCWGRAAGRVSVAPRGHSQCHCPVCL